MCPSMPCLVVWCLWQSQSHSCHSAGSSDSLNQVRPSCHVWRSWILAGAARLRMPISAASLEHGPNWGSWNSTDVIARQPKVCSQPRKDFVSSRCSRLEEQIAMVLPSTTSAEIWRRHSDGWVSPSVRCLPTDVLALSPRCWPTYSRLMSANVLSWVTMLYSVFLSWISNILMFQQQPSPTTPLCSSRMPCQNVTLFMKPEYNCTKLLSFMTWTW